MEWTSADIISVLYIVVAVMLILVLYHILFIVVDARKTMRRVDRVSASVENVVVKPLSMVDRGFDWAIQALFDEHKQPHGKSGAHHGEHHKHS